MYVIILSFHFILSQLKHKIFVNKKLYLENGWSCTGVYNIDSTELRQRMSSANFESQTKKLFNSRRTFWSLLWCIVISLIYQVLGGDAQQKEEAIDLETEELQSEDSYVFDPPPVTSKELLLPPIYDPTANLGDVELTERSEIEPFIRGSTM